MRADPRVTRAVAGRRDILAIVRLGRELSDYYTDFVRQQRRGRATIREGVDRGLGLGITIREQRGRGNVMEATISCEVCMVVDNQQGGIKSC